MTHATAHASERFRLTPGHCNRCDEPIAPERLDAVPNAMLCLPCQAFVEREADNHGPNINWAKLDDAFGDYEPRDES